MAQETSSQRRIALIAYLPPNSKALPWCAYQLGRRSSIHSPLAKNRSTFDWYQYLPLPSLSCWEYIMNSILAGWAGGYYLAYIGRIQGSAAFLVPIEFVPYPLFKEKKCFTYAPGMFSWLRQRLDKLSSTNPPALPLKVLRRGVAEHGKSYG